VFVIGPDDIRRSGARNLPDLLRMAPGVDVAQIDANAWAITIRGFNSRYSNKVLVLVDGRSVYTPSFSGVYWDQLEMPLENIERIEVVRGPGGSVWGANAVNGVINIITKPSKATQGGLATAEAGTQGTAAGLAQYGATAGQNATYRAFTRYSRTGDSILADGSNAADGWSRIEGGFRSDWAVSKSDSLTVEGDLFANRGGQTRYQLFTPLPSDVPFAQRTDAAGGNVLAEWTHTFAGGSDTSVRAYFDTYRRDDLGEPESQKTVNVDFQHHFTSGDRHDVVWGLGYRVIRSGVPAGYQTALNPPFQSDQLYSGFVQDEIRIAPKVWLTPGIRLEHNAFTGFEFEPSVRLAWAPTNRQTLWASASRAIRQPSREEMDVDVTIAAIPLNPFTEVVSRLSGNLKFRSEEFRDVEVGYRRQWTRNLSLDIATFLGSYRHLSTIEPQAMVITASPAGVLILAPVLYSNQSHASTYGAEVAVNYNIAPRWRISPGYSFERIDAELDAGSHDTTSLSQDGTTPAHQFQFRSAVSLSRKLDWEQTVYWYGGLTNHTMGSHARLDSRIALKLGEHNEFSVVGQNLLRPGLLEYGNAFELVGSQVQRAIFGKLTWSF
jgi:iron complex outermembrane receptor protein